jgi:hypothetical protein
VTSPYGRDRFRSTFERPYLGSRRRNEVCLQGGPIENRGRCIDWRRQFRSVTSRKARDRIRCTSEAVELVRGAKCGVGKRRRAFGGSERGALTCGAGGRAFENRLIARRSSTAAVAAGTADVDDRVKGNVLRLVRCGRTSAACRAGQPSRSLRQAPRPAGAPPLFAPTTEKWKKTAVEIACNRGNCPAATFGDVAARNRNETADSGSMGAETAAVRRPSKGRSPTQTAARATPPLLVTIEPVGNPPYLIQISTSQRKSALLRRRVSARRVQRTEIRESTMKGRSTRHEKPPNRSLTRCQNGRPSEVKGRDPVRNTRLVETFPTTPRSPFLPNR